MDLSILESANSTSVETCDEQPQVRIPAGWTQPVGAVAPLGRIVIAISHPISRSGLRWLLESEDGLSVVGKAGTASDAVERIDERPADVLLVDLALCGDDSFDTLRALAASRPYVRIVVMADNVDNPALRRTLQLGVRGMIFKDATAESLLGCMHAVMAGHYWLDGGEVTSLSSALRALEMERRHQYAFDLTRREVEIIRGVVAGWSNKEIAQRSSISENTVKCHLTRVFNKLGASSRVELAVFAAYHGLVQGA